MPFTPEPQIFRLALHWRSIGFEFRSHSGRSLVHIRSSIHGMNPCITTEPPGLVQSNKSRNRPQRYPTEHGDTSLTVLECL